MDRADGAALMRVDARQARGGHEPPDGLVAEGRHAVGGGVLRADVVAYRVAGLEDALADGLGPLVALDIGAAGGDARVGVVGPAGLGHGGAGGDAEGHEGTPGGMIHRRSSCRGPPPAAARPGVR